MGAPWHCSQTIKGAIVAVTKRGQLVAVSFTSIASQDWLITPAALAVDESPPSSISDQTWVIVFSGVGILDLQGNNAHDWRRETLVHFPNIDRPLKYAISKYSIPIPAGNITAHIDLIHAASFAAVSSSFERGTDDAGFAVDAWRINPVFSATDASGTPRNSIFTGIQVDVAVRNDKAVIHRVSYHYTLTGKIIFLVTQP